ncbi:SDR family NAD(P)-dependent oxidoreductase, partial [Mycobacterium tuberculosis]|nr:SDR family NAD(P)-dependent oxidoreductase [Mycobacterium tuberculosis]
HTVIGTGRRQEKLDELQTQLGDNFIPLNFDVSDLPATKTALQTLPSNVLNNLDVLVNNAGLALGLEPADKTDFADWQQMV